jgi:hypothetical protein
MFQLDRVGPPRTSFSIGANTPTPPNRRISGGLTNQFFSLAKNMITPYVDCHSDIHRNSSSQAGFYISLTLMEGPRTPEPVLPSLTRA